MAAKLNIQIVWW